MHVKKQTFKMAGMSLVFGQAKVLKSSWEKNSPQVQRNWRLELDLKLQHKHFPVIE